MRATVRSYRFSRSAVALVTATLTGLALVACSDSSTEADTTAESTTATTVTSSETATSTTTAAATTITDSYGNEFELPVSFNEVIALNSSAYEMIELLGQGDKVVGVGDTVTGGNAEQLDKYGDWREPNVEAILEAQPDAVFGYASWLEEGIAEQLEEGGVRVVMVDLSQPSKILDEITFMGQLLDAEDRAEEFTTDVTAILDDVEERTAGVTPATAYWEGYSDYASVGPGSGGHEILELAGVENLLAEADTKYPDSSDEFVLEQDPDVIVKMVSSSANAFGPDVTDETAAAGIYDSLVARPGWEQLSAVQDGTMILLSHQIGTNPLGMAIAPLYIASLAYPEEFADVDPAEKLNEMLEKYWDTSATGVWTYQG